MVSDERDLTVENKLCRPSSLNFMEISGDVE